MKKDIVKIIIYGVLAYPVCMLVAYLEGMRFKLLWLMVLIAVIIVCSMLILYIIYGKKK